MANRIGTPRNHRPPDPALMDAVQELRAYPWAELTDAGFHIAHKQPQRLTPAEIQDFIERLAQLRADVDQAIKATAVAAGTQELPHRISGRKLAAWSGISHNTVAGWIRAESRGA